MDPEEGELSDVAPVESTTETGDPVDSKFKGSSPISHYSIHENIGNGTFGMVLKGTHISTTRKVALKKLIVNNEDEGIPVTALREIKTLQRLKHENVIELIEIAVQKGENWERGCIYMVFPLMEHDLAGLLGNPIVTLGNSHIRYLKKQMLQGVEYLHSKKIIHRDLKGIVVIHAALNWDISNSLAANILISNQGVVKIGDFGLARDSDRQMTTCVVTLWYRAPELLLSNLKELSQYSTAVDMWSLGCIFAEIWKRTPIFTGKDEFDQLKKIFDILGTPDEHTWPEYKDFYVFKSGNFKMNEKQLSEFSTLFPSASYQDETYNLLSRLLTLNPKDRLTATQALKHIYFDCSINLDRMARDFEKFPRSHEMEFRKSKRKLEPFVEHRSLESSRDQRHHRESYPRDRDHRDRESGRRRDSRDTFDKDGRDSDKRRRENHR